MGGLIMGNIMTLSNERIYSILEGAMPRSAFPQFLKSLVHEFVPDTYDQTVTVFEGSWYWGILLDGSAPPSKTDAKKFRAAISKITTLRNDWYGKPLMVVQHDPEF